MNNRAFLLLGGYGGVGRTIAPLLLKETGINLIIAGRRKEKAYELAARLNTEFPDNRVTSCYADASNQESLIEAFRDVKLVIILTPTPHLIKQIGQVALNSGCDYLDVLASDSTLVELEELNAIIQQRKRIFITQAGFHPGLSAVFLRHGAQYFDHYHKASIAMAMNARFERAEQAVEIISMVANFSSKIFKNGTWRTATYQDSISLDMGHRFGKTNLFPFWMEEMRAMPEKYGLNEAGVYISGFNWFVDYFVFPLVMLTQKIKNGLAIRFLLKLFTWGVNTFSSSRQGVFFLNEAEGIKDGKKVKVRIVAEHDDAYLFTAVPVVACLKQYLDDELTPGLSMMGLVVDDTRLFDDMEKMGLKISRAITR